jgi:hypothetical protein
MNTDTSRSIKQIKERGYWRRGQTLGDGGWAEVYTFASDWKNYTLIDGSGEVIERITAQDDKTAVKAFAELYHLEEIPDYEILERIQHYRTVAAG